MSVSLRWRSLRRLQVVLGLALMGLVLAPATSVGAIAQDSVTASGTSSFCGGQLTINAQSGPNGVNPTGQVTCSSFGKGLPSFSGPVTCLNVEDNTTALLVAQTSQFGAVALRVSDNDPSGTDRIEAIDEGGGCPTPVPQYIDLGFSGSLEVTKAPVLPTSKEQCKDGGWRSFGVFKNQGDCVSFIATGGKNQPG
jgi:hypothetical protein